MRQNKGKSGAGCWWYELSVDAVQRFTGWHLLVPTDHVCQGFCEQCISIAAVQFKRSCGGTFWELQIAVSSGVVADETFWMFQVIQAVEVWTCKVVHRAEAVLVL